MNNRILAAAALALLAACAQGAPPAPMPENALRFPGLAVAVDPVVRGKTDVTLNVRTFDAEGRPAASTLEGNFVMPAMGSMAEMREQVAKTERRETHAVDVSLAMAGKWFLTLKVTSEGGTAELRYAVNTLTQEVALERTTPPLERTAAEAEGDAGGVFIPPARRQLIGVTFAPAEVRALAKTVRAFGRVALNEQSLAAVNLQVGGWARKVYVKDAGARVRAGEPLLALFSPELAAAQEELLIAARSNDGDLLRAAESKLRALGMADDQIAGVERDGRAKEQVLIRAPRAGYVVEKEVVEGARVEAGMTAFRIGNLGRVWVMADIYESDAADIRVGQKARIRVAGAADSLEARVGYVYPTVDEKTRTLPVRLEITNAAETLKPGMAADVYIDVPQERGLAVPREAVLVSGDHRYVFVDRGAGYLEPREVHTAGGDDAYVRVVHGLSEGERVSTSANFLISSEARLQNALPKWGAPESEGAPAKAAAPAQAPVNPQSHHH